MRGNLHIAACAATSAARPSLLFTDQFYKVTSNGDLSGLEIPNDFVFRTPVHDLIYVFARVEGGRETELLNSHGHSDL